MAPDSFEYDVAISFKNADLPLALQIADLLQPALKAFVYSRQQETVAATDGLDSFRSVFRTRARLSVVLLRDGWGKTPWTGVEEVAIKDRCLQTKYKSLVVVHLDDSASPDWVPDTHIHVDLKSFSMDELAGVIKARALECGADLKTPSMADRAEAMHRRRVFDQETQRLLDSSADAFNDAVTELKDELRKQVEQISERTGWKFECGEPAAVLGGFIISTEGKTLQLVPYGLYVNTAREACFYIRQYDMGIPVQKPGVMYNLWHKLEPRSTTKLEIHRDPSIGWCWKLKGKVRTIAATAEAIMGLLIDVIK